MNGADTEEEWLRMKKWSEHYMRNFHNKAAIGAGGNINKLHKLSLRSLNKALGLSYIKDQFNMISALDVEERVTQLGLNFDRADIIVYALPIYMKVMQWAGVGKVYVPKIGVSDGLIRDLYHKEYKGKVEGQQSLGIHKKRKGAAKPPFYLNRHENLLSQNVPLSDNPKVGGRFTPDAKKI